MLMVVIIQLYSIAELATKDKKLYHSGESLIILGVILSNVSLGLAELTGTLLTLTLPLQQ